MPSSSRARLAPRRLVMGRVRWCLSATGCPQRLSTSPDRPPILHGLGTPRKKPQSWWFALVAMLRQLHLTRWASSWSRTDPRRVPPRGSGGAGPSRLPRRCSCCCSQRSNSSPCCAVKRCGDRSAGTLQFISRLRGAGSKQACSIRRRNSRGHTRPPTPGCRMGWSTCTRRRRSCSSFHSSFCPRSSGG